MRSDPVETVAPQVAELTTEARTATVAMDPPSVSAASEGSGESAPVPESGSTRVTWREFVSKEDAALPRRSLTGIGRPQDSARALISAPMSNK
jgi:hypothetical protein